MRFLPLVMLLLMANVASAYDPPSVVHYAIHGTTDRELGSAMRSLAPADPTGRPYPGRADWNVSWTYRWQSQGNRCLLTSPSVQLKGTITLPRWDDRDRADPELQQRWDRFLAALTVHEQGHFQFGVAAADELRRQFVSLKSNKGCARLEAEVDRLGRAIVEEYQQRDRQYDVETSHGLTQDAVL
ncbi:DUF922 domain-containing Zn-dependent protease [Stenotrophomonas sp. SORGH_AS_0321]|uniref:DUF922 domain-containing Zn-dependent protease n=1 Tax=Stenotrophomonas sp. SORGH_AS_0321 TaxID=3041787 RepID=UPI00285BF177|nr:DUF922 domain-containing Zn-dependent protease [Stenotrophomonas sp. SORGH_AS_0321]MDR6096341.1 putative secreted Zn-dependent protease [Stenotrophomonas sp. SORGH_AS_0321]